MTNIVTPAKVMLVAMSFYVVFVDDNFHYMDESERYKLGEFADCHSATAACRQIVDEFLANVSNGRSAKELFEHYTTFGEDPWISTDDPDCKFSAWTYAQERCRELATKPDAHREP
jgi:hypothetical protein